jgi:hypothetical protein
MEHVEALRRLAKEYSVRSPQKLKQVAEKIGAHFTLKECQQALQTSVPAQTLGPPPRSLGHSAAEGPGSRLQADLMDFSQNTHGHHNDQHRYALQVSDVFTRKAYTEPLKGKSSIQVDSAMRKIRDEMPSHFDNAVVTTDKGGEFAGLDKVLPAGAVHRYKEGVNDISVVDRTMQTLKKDLEDKAQTTGQGWAHNLKEATSNYNFRPNAAVHGSPETAGDENPQTFMLYQDQAANFMHNRALTMSRKSAIEAAGAYREPIDNGGRSFKPSYGDVHNFKKFGPGGGTVEGSRGSVASLKLVRPVTRGSEEPMAHITFQKRAERQAPGPRHSQEPPEPEPRTHERPRPNVQEGGSSSSNGPMQMEPPRPNVQEGGSVGSHEPMAARFTAAQLRRSDPLSAHIMNYAPKTTEQQRQEREARKAAAQALRDNARNQRIEKAAAKEVAKLRKQHETNMKKPIR